jgi:hypothetical protein
MHLYFDNKKDKIDITIDIPDLDIHNGNIFLEPTLLNSGMLSGLKKAKIINRIIGVINYNYVDIPIAILNMGKLRKYDALGVSKHLEFISIERGLTYNK